MPEYGYNPNQLVEKGCLELDFGRNTCRLMSGDSVALTPNEMKILGILDPYKVKSAKDILKECGGCYGKSYVGVMLNELRERLGSEVILTVRRNGFRLSTRDEYTSLNT